MKYFYVPFLTIFLFPLFASAQNANSDTAKIHGNAKAPAVFFAGVALDSFSNSFSSSTDELGNAKSSKTSMPGFNLGVDVPFDANNRWIFRVEAGVTSNKDNFNYQYTTGAVTTNDEALGFKQTIINISPQVILNVVKTDGLDVYVSTGINIDIRHYTDQTFTTTITYTASGTTSTGANPPPDFKSATFCVPAKVGVVIAKHVNIYAAYTAKTSLNNDSSFAINESAFTAGINYIFGAN
jgi:hypothetical protein